MQPGVDVLDVRDVLRVMLHRPSWQQDAACLGRRPAKWFPGRGEDLEPARQVCRGCPVRVDCLEFALALPVADDGGGVWAGTSRKQRARARARGLNAAALLAELERVTHSSRAEVRG